MKCLIVRMVIAMFIFFFLSSCSVPDGDNDNKAVVDARSLKLPELKFDLPQPERVELANGMVIYLFEDRQIPVVSFYAVIRAGMIYEPSEKAGLASLTGEVLRSGGTRNINARELDEKLEFNAITCEFECRLDRIVALLTTRTENLDEAIGFFADILRNPQFEEARIELAKQKAIERFIRESDEPYDLVTREFEKIVYRNHPYSRRLGGYPETIKKITRDDILNFYSRYFHPNNIIIGVAGDFAKEDMLAKINNYFSNWQKFPIDFPAVKMTEYILDRHLIYIPKDLQQASFFIGHIGVDRLNPDYFSIVVMNFILGEDFISRLNENVRTKAGLAYAVGSYWNYYKFGGDFVAYCSTKTESSFDAVSRILDELKRIRDEAVPEKELENAKSSLCNKYVFKFETGEDIMKIYVDNEFMGLPKNYLKQYIDNVKRVTAVDVQNAAKKYIHPDKTVIVIIGADEAINTFPKDFGNFQRVEIKEEK